MRTLIINGSPRPDGNTAFLVNELKKKITGQIVELSSELDDINPCKDCRYCWKTGRCVIKDDMQIIYNDDFDNVVIASPIYISTLPGPMVNLANRLQVYYAAKRFLNINLHLREKQGYLIIVGGGDGTPNNAISLAEWMFRKMNASYNQEDIITSLNTDTVPANEDEKALNGINTLARKINNSCTKQGEENND